MPLPPDLNEDLQLAIEAARRVQRVSRPLGIVRRDGRVADVADLAGKLTTARRGKRAPVVPLRRNDR